LCTYLPHNQFGGADHQPALGEISTSGYSLDQIDAHLLAPAEDLFILKFPLVLMAWVLPVLTVLPPPAEMPPALPVVDHLQDDEPECHEVQNHLQVAKIHQESSALLSSRAILGEFQRYGIISGVSRYAERGCLALVVAEGWRPHNVPGIALLGSRSGRHVLG